MFNVNQFLVTPYEEETTTFKLDGEDFVKSKLYNEEFLLKRIDGIEMLRLTHFAENEIERQVPYVIGISLLDSEKKVPIGPKLAAELVRRYYKESIKIFQAIMKFSNDATDLEDKIVEEERKNFNEVATDPSTGNGVSDSDATQEQLL